MPQSCHRRVVKTPMQKILALTLMAMLLAVSAMGSAQAGDKAVYGTLTGAGFGGLVGNQFGHGAGRIATTTAGVFVGGMIGNSVGRSLEVPFERSASYSSYSAYAVSNPIVYSAYVPNYVAPPAPSPPPPPIYIDNRYGSYCREYSRIVQRGDQVQESYGTACLQPDGSWKVVHP